MTTKTTRISAIERLRDLPSLFRGGDVTLRFGWPSKQTSHYCYLWQQQGLIKPLGGHADVFANLVINPNPDWGRAVAMAMPSATFVGLDVLRGAGWITQIVQKPSVAVIEGGSQFTIHPYDVEIRNREWFNMVSRGDGVVSDDPGRVRQLAPAWALADLLAQNQSWLGTGLDPDDVLWDQLTGKDCEQVRKACRTLKVVDSAVVQMNEAMEQMRGTTDPRAALRALAGRGIVDASGHRFETNEADDDGPTP